MTLYLLKVHLLTFLSIPITQKCQILSCDALVANERYVAVFISPPQHTTIHFAIDASMDLQNPHGTEQNDLNQQFVLMTDLMSETIINKISSYAVGLFCFKSSNYCFK